MVNYFSPREASNILDIKQGRLRYWNRIGLVKPGIREKGRTYYDFQDLICLKTAQGLVTNGLPATKIKRSIDSLKERFPGFDDYWANKRIYAFGNRAIIGHKNRLIDSQSGQLLFRFDVDELAQQVENRIREFESRKTAEDWFGEGLSYDRAEKTHGRALHAYQQALRLDPNLADAYVNMGNIYCKQDKFSDAQRCYRLAIDRDPSHAKAYFNLGNVIDELGATEEAILCYQKSVEADPDFPDVYYNLAIASEKLKQWKRAIGYWKDYLNFDSDTEHAQLARKRIKLLQSNLVPK
jgi:tetratricopeptide (TPR) repeat protein